LLHFPVLIRGHAYELFKYAAKMRRMIIAHTVANIAYRMLAGMLVQQPLRLFDAFMAQIFEYA
jgi:hypothetical protein